jgi:outer membrane biosynthesis protein TonB
MLPHTQPRKKRNSSKVNLIISFTFHAVLVGALLYFAARQGFLGTQIKTFAVNLEKPKPPEKPPEKPKEIPKPEPPKEVSVPKPVESKPEAAPPPAATAVAPAPAELPTFTFAGGADVTSGDPVQVYKSALESAFLARWNRPEDPADDSNVAEVEVSVGRNGQISDPVWQKGSGNSRWDDTVRAAIAALTSMDTPPPTNFPPRVMVKFDIHEETESDSLLQ